MSTQHQLHRLKALKNPFIVKPNTKVWIYSGDSDISNITAKFPDIYLKDNTESWNGYTGQETVIVHNFDPKQWYNFDDLNTLINSNPLRVKTDCGVVNYISSNFVIITSDHPNKWRNTNRKLKSKLSGLISVR